MCVCICARMDFCGVYIESVRLCVYVPVCVCVCVCICMCMCMYVCIGEDEQCLKVL